MQKDFLKKFCWLLVLIFLTPTFFAFAHAIENHEHTSCFAKGESHIHTPKTDCAKFHFLQNFETNQHSFTEVFNPEQNFESSIFSYESVVFEPDKFNFSLRAPLITNVLSEAF